MQAGINDEYLKNMEMHEYSPGDVVPVTSSLYHVAHHPTDKGEHLQTFYAGDQFPPCPACGMKVRYLIRATLVVR
jgi:hypothetical protein